MLHARAPKGKTATSYSTLMLLQALSGLSETGETLLFKQKNKHSFSIRHSLMCSVMGQLSFKIEHKLKCSTELDLSSKCSHVQPYFFLESFFKTYHTKMDCERFFLIPEKGQLKNSASVIQFTTNLHRNMMQYHKQFCCIGAVDYNVNLLFAHCLLFFIFNQNIWIDIWTDYFPWRKIITDNDMLNANINWRILMSLKLG